MNYLEIRQRLEKKGGNWIGNARNWMQRKIRRGDTLSWDSYEDVTVAFRDLQDLALEAAIGAIQDMNESRDIVRDVTCGLNVVLVTRTPFSARLRDVDSHIVTCVGLNKTIVSFGVSPLKLSDQHLKGFLNDMMSFRAEDTELDAIIKELRA